MKTDEDFKIFIARSGIRIQVLQALGEKPQIASFLAKDLKKHRESISRIFLDFLEKGLVVCQNPDEKNFRYYKLTKKGKGALDRIREIMDL